MPVSGAPIEIPPGPMFWVDFDYLLWRSKGGLLPPLVAGANVSGATVSVDPRVTFPLTDDRINGDLQSGFRLAAGMWLDKPRGTGIEGSYTMFLSTGDVATYYGTPSTVIGRPFVDVRGPALALFQLSTPSGSTQGAAQVRTTFDSDGFEVNMLRRGPAMIGEEMHWIFGVRYFGLEESLVVDSMTQSGGLRMGTFDSFATRNQFYGGQFGGRWSFTRNDFTIELVAKLAVGGMGQEVVVQGGSTAVMGSGARVERPGGLLALQSNIGDYDRIKFVIIRDTQLNVNYCLTENISLRLGGTFMWVSNVVRPGDHVDMGINPTLLPFSGTAPQGPIRPTFKYDGDVFWMYGINIGVTIRF
jgi:hypothetical protein